MECHLCDTPELTSLLREADLQWRFRKAISTHIRIHETSTALPAPHKQKVISADLC